MWEVNVYKSLVYFFPAYKKMPHGEFRMRLAFAFLTLGKVPYPGRTYPGDAFYGAARAQAAGAQAGGSGDGVTPAQAPLPGGTHEYVRKTGFSSSTCGYCGNACYWYCLTCEQNGLGRIHVCGPKCKGICRKEHADGVELRHGSWRMSAVGR